MSLNRGCWSRTSKTSKHFKQYIVYVLLCYNKQESFLKIGKSFRNVSERFVGSKLPYDYSIARQYVCSSAEECSNLEIKLHKKFSKETYKPKTRFEGYTECFLPETLLNPYFERLT